MPVKIQGEPDPTLVSFAEALFRFVKAKFRNLYGIEVSKVVLKEFDRKEMPIWAAIELDSQRHWIVEADSCVEVVEAVDELCENYDEGLWQDAIATK